MLRISCIEEAFSGGTASVSLETTSHPLPRAVYEAILGDEARHRRLGGLYFEWALARIDEAELARLGQVLLVSLKHISAYWRTPKRDDGSLAANAGDLAALGWLVPQRFAHVAKEVVVRDILDPLETIGIAIPREERDALLA